MAGTILLMSKLKQMLIMYKQGIAIKSIARNLGISKNTVKSYLFKLKGIIGDLNGKDIDYFIELPEHALESKFHSGNPAYKQQRYDDFKLMLPHWSNELKKTGATVRELWQEYREQHPQGYGYTQFCHHIQQHEKSSQPSAVLHHQAGEKLMIDFAGHRMHYIDRETGEQIKCHLFIAVLPYSGYSFCIAVHSQSSEDFIYAFESCIRFLGGSPKAVVPDNLKSAVTKANKYEPDINRLMEDICNHYQMAIIPARPYKPKDKSNVEHMVRTMYTRVVFRLRNQQFFDLKSLNDAIAEQVKLHNQTRMQLYNYTREDKFFADEKGFLQALNEERFEIKSYKQLTVAKNNHIILYQDKHYYSVPYQLIGQKVQVIYTRNTINVYHKGEQVAVHYRNYVEGGYSTKKEHLCSTHQYYQELSPDKYKERAQNISSDFYQYIHDIFTYSGKHPEQLYKICDGLFSLCRKTDRAKFDEVCRMNIEYRNYSYSSFKKMLENNDFTNLNNVENLKSIPRHGNIRGREYYQ